MKSRHFLLSVIMAIGLASCGDTSTEPDVNTINDGQVEITITDGTATHLPLIRVRNLTQRIVFVHQIPINFCGFAPYRLEKRYASRDKWHPLMYEEAGWKEGRASAVCDMYVNPWEIFPGQQSAQSILPGLSVGEYRVSLTYSVGNEGSDRKTDAVTFTVAESPRIPSGAVPVYATSFETEDDLADWKGYGWRELRNDAPSDGGKQSLFVSGGDVWPHASITLPAFTKDCKIILRCHGKDLEHGGYISLDWRKSSDLSGKVFVEVNQPNWKVYQTSSLFCPAGTPIRLSLSAGSWAYSGMLVDLIEVIKVD